MNKVVKLRAYRRRAQIQHMKGRIGALFSKRVRVSKKFELVRRTLPSMVFAAAAAIAYSYLRSVYEPHGAGIALVLTFVGLAWSACLAGLIIKSWERAEDDEPNVPPSAA